MLGQGLGEGDAYVGDGVVAQADEAGQEVRGELVRTQRAVAQHVVTQLGKAGTRGGENTILCLDYSQHK